MLRLQRLRQRHRLDVRRSTVGSAAPVPTIMNDMTLHVEGLRWHGPDHASRGAPVVGAPSHSYGYGVVAPTDAVARKPRSWDRGIPGTRAMARVAAHRPFRSPSSQG